MKKNQKDVIESIQNDDNYVILSNPLASPKFIRMIGKGKELPINDTYTPKIFYEVASRLKPELLEGIKRNQSIKFDIQIKDFLKDIGANPKNYKHLIQSIEIMQSNLLRWKDGDEIITTAIISKSVHNEKTGKVEIYVDSDIAKRILEVKQQSNFHFLKSNIFRLQNAQAIRLYPFFKSWVNHGRYETELDRFKDQFSYNTKGYTRFSNFELRVLKPATDEINEKTDIIVKYEITGENLEGQKPRVTGLIFWITAKDKVKKLPDGERHQPIQEPQAEQEQIEPVKTQETQLQEQTPLVQEITALFKSINSGVTIEQIQVLLNTYDELRLWEIAQGALIEHKKAPIKNIIGYIKKSGDMLGLGLLNEKQEQQKKEQLKKEQEQEKEHQQAIIKEITTKYDNLANKEFKKIYDELEEDEKEKLTRNLKQGIMSKFYFDNNILNSRGVELIGQTARFGDTYDRKSKIINYALKWHDLELKASHDTATGFEVVGGLFVPYTQVTDQHPREQPHQTPTIEPIQVDQHEQEQQEEQEQGQEQNKTKLEQAKTGLLNKLTSFRK